MFAGTASHRLAGTPPDVTARTNHDTSLHNEGDVKLRESAAQQHVEGGVKHLELNEAKPNDMLFFLYFTPQNDNNVVRYIAKRQVSTII